MRSRSGTLVGLLLLATASCAGQAPPPALIAGPVQSSPPRPSAATTSAGAAPDAPADPFTLPPLARDTRSACDIARARRDRAAETLAQGKAYRALRALDVADRLCAADADKGAKLRLDALVQVGRAEDARALAQRILDASGADAEAKKAARDAQSATPGPRSPGAALLASWKTARARGDVKEAQKLGDQALARLEQEAGAGVSLFWAADTPIAHTLSADGATAVLGGGKLAVLADASSLVPQRFFDHERNVEDAALSHDGRLLATVDAAGDTFVWDGATAKRLHKLAWSGERASHVAFTSDGKRLVVLGAPTFDTAVRVWNVDTGDSITSFLIESTSRPTALAIGRGDSLLAVGSERGMLEVWSLGPKPKRVAELAKRESFLEAVNTVAFSPKGDRVAAIFRSGSMGVWDAASGKQIWATGPTGHAEASGTCVFSPDGTRLLAGWEVPLAGGAIRAWDAENGNALQNRPVPGSVLAFSEDTKRALASDSDSLALIDVAEGKALVERSFKTPRVDLLLFEAPRQIAARLVDEKALRLLSPGGSRWLPADDPRHVVFSIDGKEAATVDGEVVTRWDVATGKPRARLPHLGFFPDSLALLPDGAIRATNNFDALTVLTTRGEGAAGWRTTFERPRPDSGFPQLILSRFGRNATLSQENKLGVVDLEAGRDVPIKHGLQRIDRVSLSPDGRVLFIVADEQLHRFDAATGARIGEAIALRSYDHDVSSSFDGARVAVNAQAEAHVFTFGARPEDVQSSSIALGEQAEGVTLAPHGDLLVAHYRDGQLGTFRVTDGRRLADVRFLPGHDAALLTAPEGRVEMLGEKAADLGQELFCRIGVDAYPFELCGDALNDEDLLAEVLAAR